MDQLNQTIAESATNAYFAYFIPFLLIGTGISVFLTFLNKNPQKAAIGCCGVCALGFLAGLILFIIEFVKAHLMLVFIVAVILVLGGLVAFMVYSPPSPPRVKDDYDPNEDKDNPFYEGPR